MEGAVLAGLNVVTIHARLNGSGQCECSLFSESSLFSQIERRRTVENS